MPTSARPPNTREPPKADQTELFKWLVARGVAKRAARRFMDATRCETLHDAALYLRFELAPLQLANSDSVQADMRRLLGCGPRVARRVIADLDVFHAVNMDTNEEATRMLEQTGGLPLAPPSAEAPPSPSLASPGAVALGGHSAPHSWGHMRARPRAPTAIAEGAEGGHTRAPTFTDLVAYDAAAPLSGDRGAGSEEQWARGTQSSTRPSSQSITGALQDTAATLSLQRSVTDTFTRMPSDASTAAATRASSPPRDEQGKQAPRRRPAVAPPTTAPSADRPASDPSFADAAARAPPTKRAVSGPTTPALHIDLSPPPSAPLPPALASPVVGRSASQLPPRRREGAPLAPVQVRAARESRAMLRGPRSASTAHSESPLPPHSPSSGEASRPGRAAAGPRSALRSVVCANRTYANELLGGYADPDDVSVELHRAPVSLTSQATPHARHAEGHSYALADHPTGSLPFAPGPYHKANARLRELLPLYRSRVWVQTSWFHILLTAITALGFAAYIGIRVWYLTAGRTAAFEAQNTSVPYSWVVLAAETLLTGLGFYGHQLYWRQRVEFTELTEDEEGALCQEVHDRGVTQTVHVCVTTYGEAAEMVRECLIRLLVAPEPLDMQKYLYVCDDGHAKAEGPKKRAVVEELRTLGHLNVFYIGDRVRQPNQLNGKSANLNHVVTSKIYPRATSPDDIPEGDILMVIDCDHMCKPELFNKMGPCMRDPDVAVTLVPQWFHNLVLPDFFDSANADFFFAKMPYSFGAGMCYITGTNVMIRARAAFAVSKFAAAGFKGADGHRQIYSEDEISEDIELGVRIHAAGYKSVYIGEKMSTGEVPLEPRYMWRQRLRWLKGGHLFILGEDSLFFKKQPHMNFYGKSLYWLCPIAHLIQFFAEPVLFTLPFCCLVMDVCPYGMDEWLFYSHFGFFALMNICSTVHTEWETTRTALRVKTGYRILWFTSVKAVLNTVMVAAGWKAKGHFKFTPKAGLAGEGGGMVDDDTHALGSAESPPSGEASGKTEQGKGEKGDRKARAAAAAARRGVALKRTHAALSSVTERRRACMPLDGTLDIWVLMAVTCLSLFSAAYGIRRLVGRDAIYQWNDNADTVMWIGVIFGLIDTVPGLLFAGYMVVYDVRPWVMKLWVPLVWFMVAALVIAIEVRIFVGYTAGI